MKQLKKRQRSALIRLNSRNARAGFTLIEMLVAVTLVLVMMVLFAEVFQIAGNSISKTRGIAENDQRSRTLQTIIKADLDKRTNRWVFPFAANEDVGAPESNIGRRQGFLYISENNPLNDLDDVLHFTVMSTLTIRNKETSPYYGQAMNLPQGGGSTPNFGYNNQPDADDADLNPNNTGSSTLAEVVYFVRNGSLYRRQLLIREPLAVVGNNPPPTDNNLRAIFNNSLNPPAADRYPGSFPATTFWADFDYSAVFQGTAGAKFLGSDSLDNNGSLNAIALPWNRFGFSPLAVTTGPGRAKEFIDNQVKDSSGNVIGDDLGKFIGRFTLQECSSPQFGYPQNLTSNRNIPTDPNNTLTLDPYDKYVNGPEDDFGDGSRRGEDLMLANVHAFDVQIWDEGYQGFVNVGDTTLPNNADYARRQRLNTSYGPRLLRLADETATIANAVFDTWHPQIDIDGRSGNDNPPYRPLFRIPLSTISGASPPFSDEWQPNNRYQPGDIVFPTGPARNNKLPFGAPFFYRCISGGMTRGINSNDDTAEPDWTRTDGLNVVDGSVIWQAVENRKPLKAIRIQIRFLDTATQQLRQLTIIHSLVD